jgi:tRNA-splicing ligase RtcB
MSGLEARVPTGSGPGGIWKLGESEFRGVLRSGARAAVEAGYGLAEDLERCEDHGALPVEDVAQVSDRAMARGEKQVGSLGSGNHFLELQVVDRIFEPAVAQCFGLQEGLVTVMIHTGSRGFGHQVCSDHVREMLKALPTYGIELPDPQLAAAPVDSPHGRHYMSAMAAAANFGRANRQVIAWAVRQVFEAVMGESEIKPIYDVSHNLAKLEKHEVDGRLIELCVHRKGATRALPASYVLVGEPGNEAFASTCHGAGRTMSRHAAMRTVSGTELRDRLGRQGIRVETRSVRSLPEEAPEAYKDVEEVVRTCAGAGLSRPVARLRPIGVLKG